MSPRKRNMLEAFRTADDAGAAAKAPGPERPAPKSPLRPTAQPPRAPRPALAFPALPGWLPWVALIGVAFVVGITIGLGRRGVEASATPKEPEPTVAPPAHAPAPLAEESAADRGAGNSAQPASQGPASTETALYDARNQYCVVVATYGATAEALAWATYDHVREAKLPVFSPLVVGNKIVVLAGAAPRSEDLAKLEESIQALSRDGRPRAYGDAYRSRIDTLIRRP